MRDYELVSFVLWTTIVTMFFVSTVVMVCCIYRDRPMVIPSTMRIMTAIFALVVTSLDSVFCGFTIHTALSYVFFGCIVVLDLYGLYRFRLIYKAE